MSRRQQHPLITAMNKFDALLTTLDASNAEAFMAYVRNKVSARRPKSTSTTAPAAAKRSRRQSAPVVSTPSTLTEAASAGAVVGG